MARLGPRADSAAGRLFRELRDRFLTGRHEPSPSKAAAAEHAAWVGTHVAALNKQIAQAIAEHRPVPAEVLATYLAVTTAYGAALRDLDAMHDLRPALGPLHRASSGAAA